MNRQNVERKRDILIHCEQWSLKIRKKDLIDAANQMKDGEHAIGIVERSGTSVPFGSMDGEEVYWRNDYLVVGWTEPENDAEFFKRVKEDEDRKKLAEEREKTEYLRLKAKYDGVEMVNGNLPNIDQSAYIITKKVVEERHYNPTFGDNKECECGHEYYRHFDSYELMDAVGCKYCGCSNFIEKKEETINQQ